MLRYFFIIICLFWAFPAAAHFSEGTQLREIVLAEMQGETMVYVRTPAPLIFADDIHAAQSESRPLRSPFLYLEYSGSAVRYRIDLHAIEANPSAFRAQLANMLHLLDQDAVVQAEVVAFRLSTRRPETSFESAVAAQAALTVPSTELDPVFSRAYVEYALRLPQGARIDAVQSVAAPLTLPEGVTIDNHLTLDAGGQQHTILHAGQLHQAAPFPTSLWTVVTNFGLLGLTHIATGLDHVFLVACFALGIGWSRQLFGVVTGFTLGHSVTLGLGALGFVPAAPWFIPLVELSIAASVVWAAYVAWRGAGQRGATLPAVLLAIGIGLIHGFGFASFLSDSLDADTPGFVHALAGFNIGLEIGQVILVIAILSTFWLLARLHSRAEMIARIAVLGGIALAAGIWTIQRGMALTSFI